VLIIRNIFVVGEPDEEMDICYSKIRLLGFGNPLNQINWRIKKDLLFWDRSL